MQMFGLIGPVLAFLRQRRGWSQYELARKAGVSRTNLSSYERGSQQPSLLNVGKLLDALEVDPLTFAAVLSHFSSAALLLASPDATASSEKARSPARHQEASSADPALLRRLFGLALTTHHQAGELLQTLHYALFELPSSQPANQ